MNQTEFEAKFGNADRRKNNNTDIVGMLKAAKERTTLKPNCLNFVRQLFPIFSWFPGYKIRHNLHSDLVTGLTVGIMVVPQGMAYATLAGLDPVYGLYTCFFGAFFYMFFGTSQHISIGTFAVASMMVGTVRAELLPDVPFLSNGTLAKDHVLTKSPIALDVSPIALCSSLTFAVAVCQLLMALCRLSFLTNYISDPLVSGFTTGAAVHVLTAQLDKLMGVKIKRHSGIGMILRMWRDLIMAADHVNLWTLCISAFGIIFLSVGRDCVNPWFQRHFRVPLPLELFLVVVSIVVSSLLGFKPNYGVKIVDHVPDGMPLPSVPRLDLIRHIWLDAISIAVICYIFVFSLGKIFAKKHHYKVDSNQELFALGMSSLLASFFPVYPFGASLSRSSLCEMTGAKTQLHALFSSALLFVVILWIGPLMEPLPMAILACIVVVSLKSLFLQFRELPKLWRVSVFDFVVWLVAFFCTAFLDITYGLVISILFSLFTVVLKEQWPLFSQLGQAGNNVFRPLQHYQGLSLPPNKNVQIWRFESPLHFANAPKFVECIGNICQPIISSPTAVHREQQPPPTPSEKKDNDGKVMEKVEHSQIEQLKSVCAPVDGYFLTGTPSANYFSKRRGNQGNKQRTSECTNPLLLLGQVEDKGRKGMQREATIVLDCSAISHIDSVGVDALKEAFREAQTLNISLYFATFSDSLLTVFRRCALFNSIPESNFFPSIQDAISAAQH